MVVLVVIEGTIKDQLVDVDQMVLVVGAGTEIKALI